MSVDPRHGATSVGDSAVPSSGSASRTRRLRSHPAGDACQTAGVPPEKLHWKDLYAEVVTSGLCTGCAGCVIACPHDVLGYRDDEGIYKPFQLEEGFGARQLQPRR